MAARNLQKRLLALLNRDQSQFQTAFPKETFWQFVPPSNASLSRSKFWERFIQTQTNPASHANENLENHETGTLKPHSDSANVPSNTNGNDSSSVKYSANSNLKTSSRHDLAMIFTCKVCETRSVKTACRESYEKGVVVARCSGCNNLHLIADRLGWFGEPGSVEEYLAARGEEVKKGSVDTLNLTLEDLAGKQC